MTGLTLAGFSSSFMADLKPRILSPMPFAEFGKLLAEHEQS